MNSDGYLHAEKRVIADLNRSELPQSSFSNDAASFLERLRYDGREIVFDLSCEYGSNALLPIVWIFLAFIGFSAIYYSSLAQPTRAGLYLRFPRRHRHPQKPEHIQAKLMPTSRRRRIEIAMASSLRSALRLGFQNFDFGRWVRMLQHRDYDIIAIGWPRPVSAVQSLVSIYLVALSILGAFGKPFDF